MNRGTGSSQELIQGKVPGTETGIEIRKTICDICNPQSHCGIDAYVKDGVLVKVEGTKENPHSEGTLCSKGNSNRQYVYHKDRIRTPLIQKGERGSGQFASVSWEEALDLIAHRLLQIRKESGPESVIFYSGYAKWMRAFLKRLAHSFGSPNYCTESSVCSRAAILAAVSTSEEGWAGPIFPGHHASSPGAGTLSIPVRGWRGNCSMRAREDSRSST